MGLINRSRFIELRMKKGWSQSDLARAAKVTSGVISRIEAGLQPDFKLSVIVKLASALGVSVDSLLVESYQPDTGEIVVELQEILIQLSQQPKPIQRQAASILSGYLSGIEQ